MLYFEDVSSGGGTTVQRILMRTIERLVGAHNKIPGMPIEPLTRQGATLSYGRRGRPSHPSLRDDTAYRRDDRRGTGIRARGPLQPLVFPLGFFDPLAGFYFIGAVLEDYPDTMW